jgi:hypothetical protein
MDFAPQFEISIVCRPPWRPAMMGSSEPLKVFAISGDYEAVSKALGANGSDARDQLERFQALMTADNPNGSVG